MATAHKTEEGTWRVQVYAGKDENGKRKYISITERTRREAEREAARVKQAMEEAERRKNAGITVGEAAEQYIINKCNVLSPATVTGYRKIINNNMTDELKDIPVSLLTQQDVQVWINHLAAEHSPKTCRNAHGFLTAVIAAEGAPLTLRTTLPQKNKKRIYVPDEDEVQNILTKAEGTNLYIPVLLATQCGLRASEISALESKHIHDDYVSIEQARVDVERGSVLKCTKSTAGTRNVPIPESLAEILRNAATEDGRICNMRSTNISSAWGKFADKHKLNEALNFHALRHHYASKCMLMGIPIKYAAELMGHSSTDMLNKVYQHTFASASSKYADMLRNNTADIITNKQRT